ncbi:MAG: class I SAM-dependent methyltransferase [Bacteroidota bacterium]|jgi:hypothetical protein
MTHQEQYISLLSKSLSQNTFVKLSLSNYKGLTEGLKNCYVKKIQIKNEEKLSFTFRYQTNDIVKNHSIAEGLNRINELTSPSEFKSSALFTTEFDLHFEYLNTDKIIFKKNVASKKELPSLNHNIEKKRLIQADGKSYLYHLDLTDEKGKVHQNSQDKFKQINHYIELLNPLIKKIPTHQTLQITDMGSGKGYLTFSLYDYLVNTLKINTKITGIEIKKDLVEICNQLAEKSNFQNLHFEQGTIAEFNSKHTNVLIALHACDTATDDAIYKGIIGGADLIVVAPCCHKQIRHEIEKHKVKNELNFLIKHGIFLERQAEMVTDGLRSLILEYHGYTTKIMEFVSDLHTPKNVMITAEKKSKNDSEKKEILSKIKEIKKYFGIEFHQLEKLFGI